MAPTTATPSRSHWYVNAPRPSASPMPLVFALSVWFSVRVPLIRTDPVGGSLTLAIAAVGALVSDSGVPQPSVHATCRLICAPTSASPSR